MFCCRWRCCRWWWWWWCRWWYRVLPVGFPDNSSEFRPIPGPELTGSGRICRGQRVSAVVVVGGGGGGGGGVVSGAVGCCQPVSTSIPASSGLVRTRSGRDLVGSVGGSGLFCCCWCCCRWWWWWWWWWCCWWYGVLPIGFHDNSSEHRPSPDPELTGSGWICRGQRVVLLLLVVVLLVA